MTASVKLAGRQVRFTNKAFWRNPASAFFTFAFPLMFLVIFTALLGGGDIVIQKIPLPGGKLFNVTLPLATYFVGAMATFGVISACFTNIAMTVAFQRDQGILKRVRGTPLPSWAYLFGRVVHALFVATILVTITLIFGRLFYSANIPTGAPLFEFILTLVVGALSFTALALALTSIIPNADAAPPMVNAIVLPLLFISGIFIPLGANAPQWIKTASGIFPVRHFADAMRSTYLGNTALKSPLGVIRPYHIAWGDLLIIAAWGLVGLILAVRKFSWEPRK